jgi:hypothetical protein
MFAQHFLKRLFTFMLIIGLGIGLLFVLNDTYQGEQTVGTMIEEAF